MLCKLGFVMKKAFITGITGQDGSYLAEFLLNKGYEVHGLVRRSSSFNTARLDGIYQAPQTEHKRLILHYGDLTEDASLYRILRDVAPHEIYNLAAQSHVSASFENPVYTSDVNALGVLRLLEAVRHLDLIGHSRIYQASSSELFGLVQEVPQSESTPFYPRSPYAVAKLFGYWAVKNYREAFGFFACNGILFNHESPRRGATFVTKKITRGLARIAVGLESCIYLGNLDALRDWGHAKDYVEMQWLMLQQDEPDDFVIATGVQTSVRKFAEMSALKLGFSIRWSGEGRDEKGIVNEVFDDEIARAVSPGSVVIRIDSRYFRPAEVDTLLGNSSHALAQLGWTNSTNIEKLVDDMINVDYQQALDSLKLLS